MKKNKFFLSGTGFCLRPRYTSRSGGSHAGPSGRLQHLTGHDRQFHPSPITDGRQPVRRWSRPDGPSGRLM